MSEVLVFLFFLLLGKAPALEAAESSKYELKVITYNVAGLPEFITAGRGFPPLKKRFSYIAEKLTEYDIIGLQEVFVKERSIIEKKLGPYFLSHGTDTLGYKKVGSGIYTFSRWSITGSMFQMWRDAAEADTLSHKGFVVATTKVSEELSIDIFNLHMQASKVNVHIRDKQHAQLLHAIKLYSLEQGRPIILMGDFNCKKEYDDMMARMAGMGFIHVSGGLPHVDHIFFHPNDSGWSISARDTKHVFTEKVDDGLRISDHEAVETVIVFDR